MLFIFFLTSVFCVYVIFSALLFSCGDFLAFVCPFPRKLWYTLFIFLSFSPTICQSGNCICILSFLSCLFCSARSQLGFSIFSKSDDDVDLCKMTIIFPTHLLYVVSVNLVLFCILSLHIVSVCFTDCTLWNMIAAILARSPLKRETSICPHYQNSQLSTTCVVY